MRTIKEIANEIEEKWPKVKYSARPYLDAMESLETIDDVMFLDSAQTIILYFLANANGWRGEDARRLKTELRGHLR